MADDARAHELLTQHEQRGGSGGGQEVDAARKVDRLERFSKGVEQLADYLLCCCKVKK